MTTDKIVEIGARGVAEAHNRDWSNMSESIRDDYRKSTRFAVEALRAAGYEVVPVEPTEAMVDAGDDVLSDLDGRAYNFDTEAKAAYRAMIAAKDTET